MISKNQDPDFIPQPLYDKIAKCLPIVSVEAVIVIDDKLLFLKINNELTKGEW